MKRVEYNNIVLARTRYCSKLEADARKRTTVGKSALKRMMELNTLGWTVRIETWYDESGQELMNAVAENFELDKPLEI